MMSKVVFDTSFLSSFYNHLDVNHKEALRQVNELAVGSKLVMPAVVLLEFNLVINRPEWKKLTSLERVKGKIDKVIYTNQKFLDEFADFVQKTDLALKPNDYAILFTAIKHQAKLLTFDSKLNQAYLEFQGDELFE